MDQFAENARELEGSLVNDREEISFTRLEFRYAKSREIPILVFIKANRPEDANVADFINEVQHSNLTTAIWKNKTSLIGEVLSSLGDAIKEEGFAANNGWVKVNSLGKPISPGNGMRDN